MEGIRKLADEERLFFEMVKKDRYIDAKFTLLSHPEYIDLRDQVKKNMNIFLSLIFKNGETVLHWAAKRGHYELYCLLIESKADVNIQDIVKKQKKY